jgi:hypothetical protein
VTPELRALQDELHERLVRPINRHQSPEDTQRDWTDIRRAYAHHVHQANGWDLPLLPAVPFRTATLATGGFVTGPDPLLASETGCDLVAPPARPAETEPVGEIVVNIEPNLEAFRTRLTAELAQPAWRHPFLVTRDKIEQAFRELFG